MPGNKKRRFLNNKPKTWLRPLILTLAVLVTALLTLVLWLNRPQYPGQVGAWETAPPDRFEDLIGHPPESTPPEDEPTEVTAPPTEQTQPPTQKTEGETEPAAEETKPTSPPPTQPPYSRPPRATEPEPEVEVEAVEITCDKYSVFSGQYPEDGRDELVSGVAAILVTNRSDRFLDLATIFFEIDGKKAAFLVTGLPAGRSAWVMEATKLTVTNKSVFTYVDIATGFRDGVTASTEDITITANGNMLTAVNNTNQPIEDVFAYYKLLHTDGNYFGGITYRVDFGTLVPGEPVEIMAGHYSEDAEFVRIGWRAD